jgi:enamine deaminase RidA (YjgF/YER057c/UK114 family)
VRPVNTTVIIAGLLDPRWKVEIEVDAVTSG